MRSSTSEHEAVSLVTYIRRRRRTRRRWATIPYCRSDRLCLEQGQTYTSTDIHRRPTQLNGAAVAVSIEMLKHRITVVTVLGHVRAAQHEQCRSFAIPFHADMVEVEETLAGNRGLQIRIGEYSNAIRNTLERTSSTSASAERVELPFYS